MRVAARCLCVAASDSVIQRVTSRD